MVLRTMVNRAGRLAGAALVALGLWAVPLAAQGLFSPVLVVNDTLVTRYELDQRVTFLTLLGAPGDVRELALNQLTVEALQVQTAAAAGFVPAPEAIEAGEAEFAARANLTREQFIAALAQGGVDAATFRDFIAAGVAWRAYVQERFRAEAAAFPEALLDNALASTELEAGRRYLLSEIILPASTPESARISRDRAERFSRLTDPEAFGRAARNYSQVASRFRSGEVDWRLLTDLPPEIAGAVDGVPPGRASRPVELEDAIGVFFVRDVEATPPTTAAFASVDYVVLRLPAGAEAEAARVAATVERCEDLEAVAGRYPASAFSRQTTLLSALPADVAGIVAGLDNGETSTSIGRPGAPGVLMICRRTYGQGEGIDLARLRLGVLNERLQLLAAAHLNEIRARALIVGPEG